MSVLNSLSKLDSSKSICLLLMHLLLRTVFQFKCPLNNEQARRTPLKFYLTYQEEVGSPITLQHNSQRQKHFYIVPGAEGSTNNT